MLKAHILAYHPIIKQPGLIIVVDRVLPWVFLFGGHQNGSLQSSLKYSRFNCGQSKTSLYLAVKIKPVVMV